MYTHTITIRPRYNEVDSMGYVYHANYINYFHVARTELLRTLGLHDKLLEENELMLPVIELNVKYKKPAHYDEKLYIKVVMPAGFDYRTQFVFSIYNLKKELICSGNTEVVLVNSKTRKPLHVPDWIQNKIHNNSPLTN